MFLTFTSFFFFWLIIGLFFLILEMGHPGLFFFLSFCCGAMLSACLSLFFDNFALQLVIFLFSTIISFVILHCWVKHFIAKKHTLSTNIYALVGKSGLVIKGINEYNSGQVKVAGQIWSARSIDHEAIAVNVLVEVVEIKGVHLIVRPKDSITVRRM